MKFKHLTTLAAIDRPRVILQYSHHSAYKYILRPSNSFFNSNYTKIQPMNKSKIYVEWNVNSTGSVLPI